MTAESAALRGRVAPWRGVRGLAPAASVGFAGALVAALFLRMMTLGLRRDEQLYATPVALLSDHALYVDFFYNHMPGSAYLFHAMGWLTGDLGVLFTARFTVFLFWLFLLCVGGVLVRRMTGCWTVTAFFLLALVTDEILLGPAGMAGSNNFPTLALGLAGALLFLRGAVSARPNVAIIAAAGVLLGLAASFKASAVAFVAPAAVAAFMLPLGAAPRERISMTVLPLAAGGLIGATPFLLHFFADPIGFVAHAVSYHSGPHVAYWTAQNGVADDVAMSLTERLALFVSLAGSGATALVLLAATLCGSALWPGRALLSGPAAARIAVAAGMAGANAAVALIPAPAFPQYFAPSFASLLLVATALYMALDDGARALVRPTLAAACVVMLALASPRLGLAAIEGLSLRSWTPIATQRAGAALADRLSALGLEGRVATLAPIYPLEGGLPVYPELATGQFAYRVAPYADPKLFARYRTVGPDTVEAMLAAEPPAAILLGFEPQLEVPMRRFAKEHGYAPIPEFTISDRYGDGRAYVKR